MRDLLLVSLRDPYMDSDRVMPPLGIMSLHAYLTERGFIVDMTNDIGGLHIMELRNYRYIGISCMTPQKAQAEDVLNVVKTYCPDTQVIIGGPHPEFYLDECMKLPYQHIVIGDGEIPLHKILSSNSKDTGIPKVWSIIGGDLDSLPLPTRTKEFLSDYEFLIQGLDSTTILTAKGCPNRCAFCESASSDVRFFPAKHIEQQIQQCLDLGYQAIQFYDDLFAISMGRVRELCNIIKKFDIKFRCCGHARTLTQEMAELLSDAGCIEMSYGAETGSQKILNAVNKRTTVAQNHNFYKICNSVGIKAKAFMIAGLPGESWDTICDSADFVEALLKDTFTNFEGRQITNDFDVSIYYPYRGTHIRDHIDQYDLKIDLAKTQGFFKGIGGLSECAVSTSNMTSHDIMQAQKDMVFMYKPDIIR